MEQSEQRHKSSTRLSNLLGQLKEKGALARVHALESMVSIDHPSVFPEIVKALSDRNPNVRSTAADCLGALGNKEGVVPLISKLSDHSVEVRMRAAESLGDLLADEKNSPSALIKGLQDPNELVRIAVAESLGAIGDRRALPALWKAIHDASPLVRSYIAAAIGELGDKEDVAKLEKELKKETSETAKIGFYSALYMLGQYDVLEEILRLLQSNDYRVRCATASTLSEVIADKSNAPLILRTLRKSLRQEPTIAAKSSIRSSIRSIGKHLSKGDSRNYS